MSNIYQDGYFNYQKRMNSNDQFEIDAKVYIGNVPIDHLTDRELLQFFKSFGRISDIRVYKGYLFAQYENINDAKRLIKEGENSLFLKGNQLDVLPAIDQHLNSSRNCHQYLSDYQPPRRRFTHKIENDDQS